MVSLALKIATILTLAGLAAAAFRVISVALNRTTPIFFSYLLFELVRSTVLNFLPTYSAVYFRTYMVLQPVLWIFYVLMVRELFGLFFAGYPGIRTASHYVLYGAMAIGVLVSGVALLASWRSLSTGPTPPLYYELFIERGIVFALAVFLMIMLAYLPQYRVLLTRNVVVHSSLLGTFLLGDALVLLIEFVKPRVYTQPLNLALEIVSLLCYWSWAFLLTRAIAVRKPIGGFDESIETPLVRQLAALNDALTRAPGGRSRMQMREAAPLLRENSPLDSAPLEYGAKPDIRSRDGL